MGAGVIGVTSAYYLAYASHDVTVIDRHPEAALKIYLQMEAKFPPAIPSPGPGLMPPDKSFDGFVDKMRRLNLGSGRTQGSSVGA